MRIKSGRGRNRFRRLFALPPSLFGSRALFGIPLLLPLLLAGQAVCPNRFADDDDTIFENDITHIAAAGITKGCNPPTNDHYCPNKPVTRGQMAAFLTRALNLTVTATNPFTDDDDTIFENDITHIAAAGITKGCNPPTNDHYCPNKPVTRGQMAAFLARAIELAGPTPSHDFVEVTITLGAVERLAADRGVTIAVVAEGCRLGLLERHAPETTLMAPPGELRFVYVTPAGLSTEVTWTATPVDGEVVAEQPWREAPPATPVPLQAAWQTGSSTGTLRSEIDSAPALDVVSPIWWFVQADGSISSVANSSYVTDVHDRGKSIWPAVAGLDADRNHALLANPTRRHQAAVTISDEARDIGADGVNIDIEGFLESDAAHFTAFVADVADAVHSWGGIVSYDLVPRSDTWEVVPVEFAFWSTAPQRRELAALVDYTILMAYDQFNRYRPGGPVAAPWWVEDTLVYQLRYSDPHKLILGIPFYGRVWDPDDLGHPQAVSMGTLENLASSGTASLDDRYGLDRVTLPDGRFLYREDSAVIADRLGLVDAYDLGGWAAWRLGFDSPSLWDAIASRPR